MKILYFRMKGYAGIYQGMGLDEIVIPFSEFKSNIILIRGYNGCGKSTILNALSLDIDSSDNYRTDMNYDPQSQQVLRTDYPAEKEIHLLDGIDVYKILIISPVRNGSRATTKAYISRNGEELNPNGNVSSYKDVRNSILDMDPNYITLSLISSENRGLVDKSPAERKKFMSGIIGSLDFFNNCYKNLSKKSSIHRSNINNLKSKIYNIGDPDNLYSTLNAYNQRLLELNKQKSELIDRVAECKATIKILDPDNKIQDIYQSIIDELRDVNLEINKYSSQLDSFMEKYNKSHQTDISIEKQNIETRLIELQNTITTDSTSLSFYISSRDNIQTKMESINQRLIAIQSDNVKDDIVSLVDDIKEKLSLYQNVFKGTDMDISLSKSELLIGQNILEKIKKTIMSLWDNDSELINRALDYIVENKNLNEELQSLQESLSMYDELIIKADGNIEIIDRKIKIASIADNRPKGCTIDDCYFIKEALSYNKDTLLSLKDKIETDINTYNANKDLIKREIESIKSIYSIYSDIGSVLGLVEQNRYLLSRLGKATKTIIDNHTFISAIRNHHQFNEFSIISEHLNTFDLVEDYNKEKELLVKYEADLKIYNNNKSIIDSLEVEMLQYKNELINSDKLIKSLTDRIAFNKGLVESLTADLKLIDLILSSTELLNQVKEQKKRLGDKFNQVKDNISNIKSHVDDLNNAESALSLLEKEYNPLKDNIDRIGFSLSKLEAYRSELDGWVDSYDKVEFLKKACSPNTGIQSVYISIYMTQTIKIANELLAYLFNGQLTLLLPEVNSDEFYLPFSWITRNKIQDISLGSTSQKCMIGMVLAFALMSQGSVKYNIPRLDEVDSGLDTENRARAVQMVMSLIDIMNVEQCLMISHNTEFEAYNADIIHVSPQGLQFFNTKNMQL